MANEYRKAGDLEQAIALCQEYLQDQPGNMNGHVVYGQALFDSGRYDEAETTFNTALGLDPENLIALRHLGDIARLSGNAAKATQWYTRVLEADPRNDEILAYLEELKAAATTAAPAPNVEPAPSGAPGPSGPPGHPAAETPRVSQPAVPAPALADARTVEVTAHGATSAAPTPVAPIAPVAPKRPSVPLMDLDLEVTAGEVEAAPAPLPAEPAETPAVPALGDIEFTDIGASEDVHSGPIGGLELTGFESAEPEAAPAPVLDGLGDAVPTAAPPEGSLELDAGLGWDVPVAPAAHDAASDEPAAVSGEPAPEVFVTETMAELYLQQGFREEALDVYRKLAAQNPGDKNLQERVRSLESGGRSSLALEALADEVPEYAPGTEALIVMKEGDAASSGPPAATAAVAPAAPRGPTARSFFAALAQRRPLRPDGTAPGGIPAVPPASPPRGSGSVDALFAQPPSEADDAMGAALATAVGQSAEPAATIHGRPTQPAPSELSLDAVFRGEATRRASAEVPRQSQHLKFDQFFATASPDATTPPEASPVDPEAASTDDAQFQSWLKGLKSQ